ncbi:hypothetical protein [Streptomyces sp. NBC_01768]|uniref:hypothetical protein n=1 Tax=Streptomyces sp. NBC_01768 TaxID=2975938 RepID=UPI002DDA64C9|nr:hypothetical protein [Streptomyces sp. NBC_01768]WSC25279.1 hypothetical protein OG902_00240 [Streptomyces sp. NBC_01768]
MTTTASPLGHKFSYDYLADGWSAYINGGEYSDEKATALVKALMDAQVSEFDDLLPDGHSWMIHTSELHYPVGDDAEIGDLDEMLEQSAEAVTARYESIEAEVLANLG